MSIVIQRPRPMMTLAAAVMQNLRIVFFGTPKFAVPSLRRLHEAGWPIAMVVTAPDKPVGRKAVMTPSPVKKVTEELGLPVRTPATLKDETFWTEFENLKPDLCVVVAYGKLIPKKYLDIPRLGFVNVHPSLLPAYRGPSPIQSAILDGCSSTGVSIMLLDEEMDHGPILARESWLIPSGFDYPACESELADFGANLLAHTLASYAEGKVVTKPQNHANATFTKKFTREDGRLGWNQTAIQINNRIRALEHNPGTWTTWNNKILNILEARVGEGHGRPGHVVQTSDGIGIHCQDGILMLEQMNLEGGKTMSAQAFVNGHPEFISSTVR